MDRNMGALDGITPDRPLSQGNRCSCGGESVVHVFLVALCKQPFVFDFKFTHLACS